MANEKFKGALNKKIKEGKVTLDWLNHEIQERKKQLIIWNRPSERMPDVHNVDVKTKTLFYKCKHPYRKIRKEIAILYTLVNQMQNRRLKI